jgi:hypothetical protein
VAYAFCFGFTLFDISLLDLLGCTLLKKLIGIGDDIIYYGF